MDVFWVLDLAAALRSREEGRSRRSVALKSPERRMANTPKRVLEASRVELCFPVSELLNFTTGYRDAMQVHDLV